MALDIGLATGLAYRHDFQKDIQNRAMIHQLKRQKKIDNENESRLWAKEMETMAVQNPYDSAGLEKFLDGHHKKMGKWLQEHPNFRSNPQEFLTWTSKFVKPIKDNKFVKRDIAFQQQKKIASAYSASKGADDVHSAEMNSQIENYRQYGNYEGELSANQFGIKEFMFAAPSEKVNVVKELQEVGNRMRELQYNFDSRLHGYVGKVDDKTLQASAASAYSDPRLKSAIEDQFEYYKSNGLTDANNVLDFTAEVISSGAKTDFKPVTRTARSNKESYSNLLAAGQSPWRHDIINKTSAIGLPQGAIQKALGDIGEIYMYSDLDTEGQQNIKWIGKKKVEYTGKMLSLNDPRTAKVDSKGKPIPGTAMKSKYFEVLTQIPWQEAVSSGIGLYWDFNNEYGSGDIEDEWQKYAKRTKNEKGDWVAEIIGYVKFDPTRESTRLSYDQAVQPAKLVQPAMADADKYDFMLNNFSSEQINKIMEDYNIAITDVGAVSRLFNIVTGGRQ